MYRFSVISLLKRVISYLYICCCAASEASGAYERSELYIVYFPMNEANVSERSEL